MVSQLQLRQIDLPIISNVAKDLRCMAIVGYPFEVCGTIDEFGAIRKHQNIFDGDKRHGFDMEMDIHDQTIKALWHSHPNGLAQPSKDDIPCMELMAGLGLLFPWVIVTSECVTAWQCLVT